MLEQPKSLRHRKSVIGQAMDTLRGRSTNNYNENLSQENLSRKASIRDFFGTLRSSKSSGSPVTPQKDNVYATTRAQSSSPLKNETRNVSFKDGDSLFPAPSRKAQRRKSLGDIFHSMGSRSSRKSKIPSRINPPMPSLKPKEVSSETDVTLLTLPESAMEDYFNESPAAEQVSPGSLHECLVPTVATSSLQSLLNPPKLAPAFAVLATPPSGDSLAGDDTDTVCLGARDSDCSPKSYEKPSSSDRQCAEELKSNESSTSDPKEYRKIVDLERSKDYIGLSFPQQNPTQCYADLLEGKTSDWALDLDHDFNLRQAGLNTQYNSILDNYDSAMLLSEEHAQMDCNDENMANELVRQEYMDNLASIISLTAAKMTENFQVTPVGRPEDSPTYKPRTNTSELQTSDDPLEGGFAAIQRTNKGKCDKSSSLDFEQSWPNILSPVCEKNGEMIPDSKYKQKVKSLVPEINHIYEGVSKSFFDATGPVDVAYPGEHFPFRSFESLSDAVIYIFAQEHLDLSGYFVYNRITPTMFLQPQQDQKPVHVLRQSISKDEEVVRLPLPLAPEEFMGAESGHFDYGDVLASKSYGQPTTGIKVTKHEFFASESHNNGGNNTAATSFDISSQPGPSIKLPLITYNCAFSQGSEEADTASNYQHTEDCDYLEDSSWGAAYEIRMKDQDELRSYLQSDFSSSERSLLFTNSNPESALQSKTNNAEQNKNDKEHSSEGESVMTSPRAKNWIEHVREYKSQRMAVKDDIRDSQMAGTSKFSEPIVLAVEAKHNNLRVNGLSYGFESNAGSVEENSYSDSVFDETEYKRIVEDLQASHNKSSMNGTLRDSALVSSEPIGSSCRCSATSGAVAQQVKCFGQQTRDRSDSGVSFSSGFKFTNYVNQLGASSVAHSEVDIRRSISQPSKFTHNSHGTAVTTSEIAIPLVNDCDQPCASAFSYVCTQDNSAIIANEPAFEFNGTRATGQSTRVMTPSGDVYLPSTTISASGSVGNTPIQRIPTPYSSNITPLSYNALSRRMFSPSSMLGLYTGRRQAKSALPYRGNLSTSSVDSTSDNFRAKTPLEEVVRKRRMRVEHVNALGGSTETSDDFGVKLTAYRSGSEVDSGTEADDERTHFFC